jgi:NADPH:quinone reductase-like Zn-dependent oxidoreductase
MRSAVFHSFGEPSDVLKVEDMPMPEPGPGEVRVKTILAAIHNHDLLTISGNYAHKPGLPAIGGSEAVGEIHALGEGVKGVALGQRVSVAGTHGTWAEYFVADAGSVVPVPDDIPDDSAAQLIGMPLSALLLLEFIEARPGQWVVQNAATGAVAKALAQAAQAKGVHVVNLVRHDDSLKDLSDAGIKHGVSTAKVGWKEAVGEIVGKDPVVAGIDGVGGSASADLLSLLGDEAVLVSFGAMSGKPMEIPPGDLIFRQAVVKGFWFTRLYKSLRPAEIGAAIGELLDLVQRKVIRLQVDSVFDVDKVADAVRASAAPSRHGKILLRLQASGD